MVRRIVFVSVLLVWTPLQPVFYGLRLRSATRAFGVGCRVKLVGVSLKEGGVTGSWTGEENSVARRGDCPAVGRPFKCVGVDLVCSAVARRWVR